MSDQQGGSGWGPKALIVLGVILIAGGIIVAGAAAALVTNLSHLGDLHTLASYVTLIFTFGGPFFVVGSY